MAKSKKVPKENSKRVKITFEKINSGHILKPGVKLEPIDMTQVYEDDRKKVEADKIRYQKEVEAEKERFENLPCPSCKSINKNRNVISHMNGQTVYGGRNSSTVYADYLICQSCGTMYVDLNKKEIAYPYKGFYDFSSHNNFY